MTIVSSFENASLTDAIALGLSDGFMIDRLSHFVSGKKKRIQILVKVEKAVDNHQKLCQP
jgi:hypothetical protein